MSEILCKWLNEDIGLSKAIGISISIYSSCYVFPNKLVCPFLEPNTFAQDFSNGYLIGELLNKHGLQDDFEHFLPNK